MKSQQLLLPFCKHLFHSGDMTQGGVGISTSETDGRTHSYAGAGPGSGHMKAAESPGGALF